MPQETQHFDAIVIGTGQGGKPLATALAAAGKKTAIIERGNVGGTCVNDGCTPTKTMIASARIAHLAKRAGDFGVETGDVAVNLKKVRERKRKIVDTFRSSSEKSLGTTDGLTLIRGHATFTGDRRLQITDKPSPSEAPQSEARAGALELTADRIFINTGLSPVMPPIDGLQSVNPLDNQTIMELESVPQHLLVLGGGYVGLEFAQMFHRFGSQVTIVDRSEHILSDEDVDISEAVEQIFHDEGLSLLRNTTVTRAEKHNGQIRLTLQGPHSQATVCGSHLLVAAGRKPNTASLNLGATGVSTDDAGFINVNDRLETTCDGIYALGDVKGGPAFTHVSYNDYMVLKANLIDGEKQTIANRPLLYTVFIDPQLGRLGLNESQAIERATKNGNEKGNGFRIAKMSFSKVARAEETAQPAGLMKVIVDKETDLILGCSILGQQGGELMSMLQIAMMGNLRYTQLRDGMFAHPLYAEAFNKLFGSFE